MPFSDGAAVGLPRPIPIDLGGFKLKNNYKRSTSGTESHKRRTDIDEIPIPPEQQAYHRDNGLLADVGEYWHSPCGGFVLLPFSESRDERMIGGDRTLVVRRRVSLRRA